MKKKDLLFLADRLEAKSDEAGELFEKSRNATDFIFKSKTVMCGTVICLLQALADALRETAEQMADK